MFLDDTACNLASLNLMRFRNETDGSVDVEALEHASRLWTIVLEISVMMAQYPSRRIAELSYRYRTLGLGYANLGALLMARGPGLRLGRKAGRSPAPITAIMTGAAYATSAEMADSMGAFPGFAANREAHAAGHPQPPPRRLRPVGWLRRAFHRRRSRSTSPTAPTPSRRGRQERPGTRRSHWARSTATATPRSRSSPPPARSAW